MITIAIAGKPNCGKSTFFSAATMAHAEIANYPFTTIDANHGIAYIRTECPCSTLGIECGNCMDGVRFIPIGMVDVAGLVPDAHKGRGLGNQFLDNLRQADAILHIIDASGGTDEEGNPVGIGSHDPISDVGFIEHEMTMWVWGILDKQWPKIRRSAQQKTFPLIDAVAEILGGLGISAEDIRMVEKESSISLHECDETQLIDFCRRLVERTKPMLIVANKADLSPPELIEKLRKNEDVRFSSAAVELTLKKAAEGGFIRYIPGNAAFEIEENASLSEAQKKALMTIRDYTDAFEGTGVQQTLDDSVYSLLNRIVVYPVEDENKYCDGQGRVLPDAFLMEKGCTPHDLAYQVHTDIGNGFLYAVDARTKMRIKESAELKHGDIIKIVSTTK